LPLDPPYAKNKILKPIALIINKKNGVRSGQLTYSESGGAVSSIIRKARGSEARAQATS
jgi:16S rRNA G966 N2-methylase RsmD